MRFGKYKKIVRSPAPGNREHNRLEDVWNARLCTVCQKTTRTQDQCGEHVGAPIRNSKGYYAAYLFINYIIYMAEVCGRDIPRERLKCIRELLLHGPEVAEVVQGYCTVDMKAMHMVSSKPARSKTSRSPCWTSPSSMPQGVNQQWLHMEIVPAQLPIPTGKSIH